MLGEGLSGAATVTRAGKVTVEIAMGMADAAAGVKCTPRTRFQICSISKQFASVAAMLLVESGQLDLGAPVAPWLSGCPPQWQQVTLGQLLSHTAGVAHWGDGPGFDPSQPMVPADRIALIMRAPLLSAPGTRWRYSSPGYLMVGHLVEQASGLRYADFLRERVLVPLGLMSTSVGDRPGATDSARGYRRGEPVRSWPLDAMAGTGDIRSTVGDLARFTAALHSGSLLSEQSLKTMLTPASVPLPDGQGGLDGWVTSEGYGYGQYIGRLAGHTAFFHPGDNPGYQSFVAWLPGLQACVVLLSNDESADVEALLRDLVAAALGPDAN